MKQKCHVSEDLLDSTLCILYSVHLVLYFELQSLIYFSLKIHSINRIAVS